MLIERCGDGLLDTQPTRDGVLTCWVSADLAREALRFLQAEIDHPYRVLFDITAIDERYREHRPGQPPSDFTVVYHLSSVERRQDVRIKVPLLGEHPQLATVTDLWPSANWYERELWDMFGIVVDGHPRLDRILLPPWWQGHPLRKEHPARATEMPPFTFPPEGAITYEEMMQFSPEAQGMACRLEDFDCMFLNLGPHHPSTHGVLRVVLQMDGQQIIDLACEIGFHHRGAEKMGERQSWHTFIPYTDRIDYLAGVLNNLPYVLAVEQLAGIDVPDRARVIRIMLAELFRVISHLVYFGTFAQDLGMMSPVFYLFNDRERAFSVIEAITGGRMHPSWFRIGGVAQDLPDGWAPLVREVVRYLRRQTDQYEKVMLQNAIFKLRTVGISPLTVDEALQWGATGPLLRACGMAWDLRKDRPYGGYEQFEFDVPVGRCGDCFDRAMVHLEEIRQSLRIIDQCVEQMPPGACKADHPLAIPPPKERTLRHIETLIDHFLGVSWGPVIPPGEAAVTVEGAKGQNGYYLVSDGNTMAYRTRIRTPSFPHLQMLPLLSRGLVVPDLVSILGSIDFVMADVDR
jgi:NADH-quinone oxidoreductase subunit C/D